MKKLLLALMIAGVVSSIVAEEQQDRSVFNITINVNGDGAEEPEFKVKNTDESIVDASIVDASVVDASADTETVTITAPEAGLGTEEAAL